MSLALYLNDCAFSHELRRLLLKAGHDVETLADVHPPLTGEDDAVHFARAKVVGRVILTLNPRDFKELHDQDPDHPGILAVYQDNDPSKDMDYRQIVQAISNLESTGVSIVGGFWSLNAYRWQEQGRASPRLLRAGLFRLVKDSIGHRRWLRPPPSSAGRGLRSRPADSRPLPKPLRIWT